MTYKNELRSSCLHALLEQTNIVAPVVFITSICCDYFNTVRARSIRLEEGKKYIELIQNKAYHLDDLIQGILAFARAGVFTTLTMMGIMVVSVVITGLRGTFKF